MSHTPHSPPPAPALLLRLLPFLLLAALTLTLFLPTARNPFIDNDDDLYVNLNPHVITGLSSENIRWALTTNTAGYYIPLTWLSLQLDASLSHYNPDEINAHLAQGAKSPLPSATIFHIDNALQHTLAACLLLLFLTALTRRPWTSFFLALLWSIHPLRIESVAWVTERKDTLAALFAFLALYAYTRVTTRSRPRHLSFVICHLSFLLSLLAKPLFVTFPLILLLLDYLPTSNIRISSLKFDSSFVIRHSSFLLSSLIALIFSALAIHTQHAVGAADLVAAPLATRLLNVPLHYLQYLRLNLFPLHLSLLYPYNLHPSVIAAIAASLLLLAITTLTFFARTRYPALLLGWLWFLITSLPIIGIVQVGEQSVADRFTLLPSVGLLLMLLAIPLNPAPPVPQSPRAQTISPPPKNASWSFVFFVSFVFTVAAIACFALSFLRLQDWRSSSALLQNAILTAPDSNLRYNLAIAAQRDAFYGPPELRRANFQLAAENFLAASRHSPDDPKALYAAAASFLNLRNAPAAATLYLLFLDRFSNFPDAAPYLPTVHDELAQSLIGLGNLPAAYLHLQIATTLAPTNPRYRSHLTQVQNLLIR